MQYTYEHIEERHNIWFDGAILYHVFFRHNIASSSVKVVYCGQTVVNIKIECNPVIKWIDSGAIVVKIASNKYLYVGHKVYTFSADVTNCLFNVVGGACYTCAVTAKYNYLLLAGVKCKKLDVSDVSAVYSNYYRHKAQSKRFRHKVLHKPQRF